MGPRKTGNSIKDYIEQRKYDLQTRGGPAVIDHIESLLYKLFSYKEKKESALKSGESSTKAQLAGYASEKLSVLQEFAQESYRETIEPEIKEMIEKRISEYLKGDDRDEYIEIVKDQLSDVKISKEDEYPGIKSHVVKKVLSELASDDNQKHKRNHFKPGDNIQKIKIDLERTDARINEYAEILARLNIIDEDIVKKINMMLKPLNKKEEKRNQDNGEQSEKQIKIDKMNHELEHWFQQQLRLIITHYDTRKISD